MIDFHYVGNGGTRGEVHGETGEGGKRGDVGSRRGLAARTHRLCALDALVLDHRELCVGVRGSVHAFLIRLRRWTSSAGCLPDKTAIHNSVTLQYWGSSASRLVSKPRRNSGTLPTHWASSGRGLLQPTPVRGRPSSSFLLLLLPMADA